MKVTQTAPEATSRCLVWVPTPGSHRGRRVRHGWLYRCFRERVSAIALLPGQTVHEDGVVPATVLPRSLLHVVNAEG